MRRLATLLLLCGLAWPLWAQVVDTWAFSSPVVQDRALSVAAKIRCPQCQNQNLLESNAPAAVAMRHEVFAMAEQGKTASEIMGFMTARYGNFVRYQPALEASTLILWGLPPLMLLTIVLVLWRSRSKR
ncbi:MULTISPECIES: cytochrome c-type biogenesis protein CcmH [unclassified Serratia (in: enterobacteria)]|uniref:cytochrome c-type biogenesis protein CcmH n=1 Tax=unclassified Serratia (in: enterobacteria) TaxID=2647522 RepID=UPI00050849B6|nr:MULTISPECIES: cytochrome c-type biogenesis protein CcmH [unclassified Serratia (in: enterobacteria)]KFK94365.1 nitrite reductase [Serratia sp. Ag2]KFK99510.1 nitrite reductase [Serratia sp. Ag1]